MFVFTRRLGRSKEILDDLEKRNKIQGSKNKAEDIQNERVEFYKEVTDRITEAEKKSGRDPEKIRLILNVSSSEESKLGMELLSEKVCRCMTSSKGFQR